MRVAFYLRVSTSEQTTANQEAELAAVAKTRGWSVVGIYRDEAISGSKTREQRPGLRQMLIDATHRKFDIVAAWSVDRLGRSLTDLLRTSDDLRALGIELYLHKQAVDTTTPTGRLTYQILGAVAEWERAMIRERVNAGVARAKASGKHMGRPKTLPSDLPDAIVAAKLEGLSMREIAERLLVSKSTVARMLKARDGWLE